MQDFWQSHSSFPSSSDAQWRELIGKTLGESGFEKHLIHKSLDGISHQAIYPQSAQHQAPGQFPFRRGISSEPSNWIICQRYSIVDPPRANRQILEELEGGVNHIELNLAAGGGNKVINLQQIDATLAGVLLPLIQLSLAPGAHNLQPAALLLALAQHRSVKASELQLAINADPLGTLATTGQLHLPAAPGELLSELAKLIHSEYPAATALCVDNSVYHNAGASAAAQIALSLASGLYYLRVLVDAGLPAAQAARQIVFRHALDNEFFESAVSLRTLRQLWAFALKHCGVAQADATIQLEAVSGFRALSRLDPSVNMLRITCQCFAAMIGGARSFHSAAYDCLQHDSEHPSQLGRRIARNTQLVLSEESGINRVVDPLGGAGSAETMTDLLSQQAWRVFQQIESGGGILTALQNGAVKKLIDQNRTDRQRHIATGKQKITGVSEFPPLDDDTVISAESKTSVGSHTVETTGGERWRADSLPNWINRVLAGESIDTPTFETAFSESAPPLTEFRDAAVFEALRSRSDSVLTNTGARPLVTLVTIGKAADFSQRVSYCENFFAAAGIGCNRVAADALSDTKTGSLAVVCSSDKQYAAQALEVCKDLKQRGTKRVWLAGRAADQQHALQEAGLDGEIFSGCDRVARLSEALDLLEREQK